MLNNRSSQQAWPLWTSRCTHGPGNCLLFHSLALIVCPKMLFQQWEEGKGRKEVRESEKESQRTKILKTLGCWGWGAERNVVVVIHMLKTETGNGGLGTTCL